jgi:hypothetical protein
MSIYIPIASGLLGLFLGHWLSQRRDLKNKKREIRTQYLIEAYRKLERGAVPNAKKFDKGDFESAIADIQLFGNIEQVKIAFEFATQASRGDGSKLQILLEDIRKDLRKELSIEINNLPKVNPFRIN